MTSFSSQSPETISPARLLADQAFSRTAGAPLIAGNSIRLLKDATENYPAWLEAIESAKRTIHFESYIIHEDESGRRFADALIRKQREGVRVRLLYDWLGGLGKTSRRFWRSLSEAGVEVRCYNPPHFGSPVAWLNRDHRKMISVDGRVGFVTGLCVGQMWIGDSARGRDPWRDTGVEIRGPAVADIELAFSRAWAAAGHPLDEDELPRRHEIAPVGETPLRVIASEPNTAGLYRLDKLIAALARRSLWLTDAYFVGTTSYVQSLIAAARDGVDVRLLVPGATDIPVLRALSRVGYRPLLEGGVRVFEWNGSMLHAKTAVADGHWARVGSTNLNLASWLTNWELDVAVEDDDFGRLMEEMFLEDLEHTTEIVLSSKSRVLTATASERRTSRSGGGSAGRAVAGAIGVGNAVGAAITDHRALGPSEAQALTGGALILLALVAVLWPRLITIPLAVFGVWMAVALLAKVCKLRRDGANAR